MQGQTDPEITSKSHKNKRADAKISTNKETYTHKYKELTLLSKESVDGADDWTKTLEENWNEKRERYLKERETRR